MNDYISRQMAVDVIEDYPHGDVWNVESMEEMVDKIKALPSVQPKRKTTHLIKYWTERKDGYGIEHIPHCKCANCDTDYLPRMAMAMNYCPNCGARFIKERDK